jgi:diguanylate cyclase (GGDEF)-like protein/PAS domain S-box-containing protein
LEGHVIFSSRTAGEIGASVPGALGHPEPDFRLLFEASPQPTWVYDAESLHFLEVNKAACAMYGYSREEFLAMELLDIRPAARRLDVDPPPLGQEVQVEEVRHRLRDGTFIDVGVSRHDLMFCGRRAVLAHLLDITHRKRFEEQLRHQAFHDPLTGLPNRALFRDRLEQALARGARDGSLCAVVFFDLDSFKIVNDSAGHSAGDALLVEVATRLASSIRESDTAARFGGDEFAILAEPLMDPEHGATAARRFLRALGQPILAGNVPWVVSASAGVAISVPGKSTAEELLRNADVAMYESKRTRRGSFGVFEPAMHEAVMKRIGIEQDLRRSVERHELSVHYQPQMDIRTGQIHGIEALVRWFHPSRGPISPDRFIPVAEECGLIGRLDAWVFETAANQLRLWKEAGLGPLVMAVNLSGAELLDDELPERLGKAACAAGLSPTSFQLEITETAAVKNIEILGTLEELRRRGFEIAIDDFGVGYSMLGRLQDFRVGSLKLDRSFMQRITFGEDEAPIISGVIAMGHSLDLRVIAEGVETTEQLRFLRRHQCDGAQGHLVARPGTAEATERVLRANRSKAARSSTERQRVG